MRKTKFKNRLWKTGILIFGILFTLTNCEKEEFQTNSFEINNSLQYSVPNLTQVKQNFEYIVGTNSSFYKKGISSKNIKNTIFIDWNNSKILKFKKQENIDILYTPVVFDKQNRRMKSFVGSITNDKNKIESNLFALFYDESSTNEQFSGFISQSDINGNLLKIYKYVDGVKQMTYSVSKKNSNKSNTASKSDCEPTWQELLQIIDMMIQSGGDPYYSLECVTVTGLLDGSNTGGGGLEPDSNLSGGNIPLGDSYYNLNPIGGGTSINPPSTSTIEQWWNEETNIISIETAVSMSIMEAIPTLTTNQINWVNDPANSDLALQVINFLNVNLNFIEAENFAELAIDTYIDKSDFNLNDFNEFNQYIPNYKARMTQQELMIFNNMSKKFQTRYLYNANKAQNKAMELFPGMQLNTKADAFRHSYFHSLNTYFIGENLSIQLGDAHENVLNSIILEKVMDLFNNQVGREKAKNPAIYFNAYGTLIVRIFDAVKNGNLKYLTPLNIDGTINPSTQLIPTNQ